MVLRYKTKISQFQFKPLRWNDKIWSLLFSEEVKEYKNCLRILHGFTNKVINERRIEFR